MHLNDSVKRISVPGVDSDNGDSDDDADSDDDDDDDSDDNQADDIAKYLGPDGEEESAGNLSDLNSLYGEPIGPYGDASNDHMVDFDTTNTTPGGDILFDGLASGTSQDSWGRGSSFGASTDHNSWSNRFAETEAAAAVDSILTESDDEADNGMDIGTKSRLCDGTKSGLCDEEDDEEEEDEEEDAEDDAEDDDVTSALEGILPDDESSNQVASFLSDSEVVSSVTSQPMSTEQPIAPCDVQMQSAIDSILQSTSGSFYDPNNLTGYSGRPYESGLNHRSSSSSMVSNFTSGQISDPVP